jgi:hypothetical protein
LDSIIRARLGVPSCGSWSTANERDWNHATTIYANLLNFEATSLKADGYGATTARAIAEVVSRAAEEFPQNERKAIRFERRIRIERDRWLQYSAEILRKKIVFDPCGTMQVDQGCAVKIQEKSFTWS